MRDQKGEVYGAHHSGRRKSGDDAMPQIVVENVEHQKDKRRGARGEHESAVLGDAPALDVDIGNGEEDTAGRVQRRVDGGESPRQIHQFSRRRSLTVAVTWSTASSFVAP